MTQSLVQAKTVKEIMQKHGFKFSKSLGQNFLIDDSVLSKIVDGSGANSDVGVLEVGPGIGTLTKELSAVAKKVVAVELDTALIPILSETLFDCKNITVTHGDILKIDLDKLFREHFCGMDVVIAANLPYYITTPIVMHFLENCDTLPIKSITIMIQSEVAERMAAEPGGKEYGALSVAVQFYSAPQIICKAGAHCFMPQPKVGSTVIRLDILKSPSVYVTDKKKFFKVVRASFNQRRKTLLNALSNAGFDKNVVLRWLTEQDLPSDIRGERLSLAQFASLAEQIDSAAGTL